MASSNADLKTRMARLRHDILSYKPGKAEPCDDKRVVFPNKLVIGIINASTYECSTVFVLKSALHGVEEASKPAVKRQTSTENTNEYLTDSVSVIMTSSFLGLGKVKDLEDLVRNLAGKVGCMVLLVNPFCIVNSLPLIKVIKEITGRFPLCAILYALRRDAIEKAKNDLIHNGITDVYELAVPNLSERSQLQWLGFLQGCLQEGDRALAINELKEIKLARGEVERLQTDKEDERAGAEKEKRSLAAEMTKKLESKQHQVESLTELQEKKEQHEPTVRQDFEELKKGGEDDRTRGTSSSEDNSTEGMGSSDTSQVGEKPPDDEFADILKQIADDLYDEADIDSLGGQLGIRQGDRERALMTNVKFNRVTSDGTRHMLTQWRRGVSREDERMELNKALSILFITKYHPREEPPDDEFADILNQIADDLSEAVKIDSLGGQLGIRQGDRERALMTNVKSIRVTSDGTRHMLKQWRRGVSREDERMQLNKALRAAMLVNLADLYLGEDTQIDAEYVNEHADDQQLSTRDETSQEQDQTEGHTDTKVLRGATASSGHTPRDGHTGDMAPTTREDLTDGSRSQHPDKSLKHSTDKFDASAVTSEDVSSGEVNAGDDMTDVSSIQPSEPSSGYEMQVLPEDMSGIAPLVSSGEKPNEESTILDKSHVGGIISNEEDLISQLVLIDTSPEKILLLFFLKIAMDVSQKALGL